MGKLSNAVQAKLNELRERELEQAPDYTADPHEALAYIKRRNAADFEQAALKKKLIDALRKLPQAKRDEFYERIVSPEARNGFTKEQFEQHLDPDSYIGQNHISWIIQDATFGQSWQSGMDILEKLMGQEETDALERMDDMADKLCLRSPAQKLIDETGLEVLNGRRDDDWSDLKADKAAAKLMYAMTVAHKGGSPEEQKKMLEPNKVEMGIALIRGQDAFKQMVKNEGLGNLMDRIAEGHGKFTDAYVKGMNDVAKKNRQPVGKAPQEMRPEEKGEIWKNNPMPL
jgi:hypothetical protein